MGLLRRSQLASVDVMQAMTTRQNETPPAKTRQHADARSRNAKKRARRAQR
jgi:hypothetical protein